MANQIYIIIVTYNGMQWISDCLRCAIGYNVVVIDNGSTDNTVDFIEKNYPETVLFKQKKNLGFGQANNVGILFALKNGAESVFLLNQDAYLGEEMINKMLKIQCNSPEYGILSPIHLNGKGDKLDFNFSKYMNNSYNNQFYSDYILNHNIKQVYDVNFVNAAGWLISKKCLETVGGFDPIFFHYAEDENFCQRVLYHGFKIGVVSGSFMRHDRENRKETSIDKLNKKHFSDLEKSVKKKYANINKSYNKELENILSRRKMAVFKNYLQLKFKTAKFYSKEYHLYKKIIPEVLSSRKINVQKGAHYLK